MSEKREMAKPRVKFETRKPKFVRQESWRYKKVSESWRRPRGSSSKMRMKLRGWPKTVAVGYKTPRAIRGMHPSGMRETLVRRPKELEELDPKSRVVRIAHTVGERKRIAILEKADELGLKVLNPKGLRKVEEEAEVEEVEKTEQP